MRNDSETLHSGTSTRSFRSSTHSCLLFCRNSSIDLVIVQRSQSIKMLNPTLMKVRHSSCIERAGERLKYRQTKRKP